VTCPFHMIQKEYLVVVLKPAHSMGCVAFPNWPLVVTVKNSEGYWSTCRYRINYVCECGAIKPTIFLTLTADQTPTSKSRSRTSCVRCEEFLLHPYLLSLHTRTHSCAVTKHPLCTISRVHIISVIGYFH
jgi:hypothetical protein